MPSWTEGYVRRDKRDVRRGHKPKYDSASREKQATVTGWELLVSLDEMRESLARHKIIRIIHM